MNNIDYSAMTNAELLAAYERETDVSERLYIYDVVETRVNTSPTVIEQLRAKADLDVARAEAQRLREQRDELQNEIYALLKFLDLSSASNVCDWYAAGYPYSKGVEFFSKWRALLDRIASEDASAQGGE